jgi:hypothetical protein
MFHVEIALHGVTTEPFRKPQFPKEMYREEHAAEQGRDYTPRRNRFLEARDDSLQQFRHGNPTILSCYDSTSRGGGI